MGGAKGAFRIHLCGQHEGLREGLVGVGRGDFSRPRRPDQRHAGDRRGVGD
jgi:hypothetical protein